MKRTGPASIRFDPEKLELVKRKEKLKTAQKVVDFLMDVYYWNNRLIVVPAMNAVAQTLPYITPQVPRTAFEAYEHEIKNAVTLEELGRIGRNLEKEGSLSRPDKEKLEKMAKQKAALIQ